MLQTLLALRNRKGMRGFTLIELLVVVAIIGILATFAFPRVYEAMQQVNDGKGRTAIKSLSTALEQEYFKSGGSTGKTPHYPMTNPHTIMAQLNVYMKKGFEFKNAHGNGYLYITTSDSTITGADLNGDGDKTDTLNETAPNPPVDWDNDGTFDNVDYNNDGDHTGDNAVAEATAPGRSGKAYILVDFVRKKASDTAPFILCYKGTGSTSPLTFNSTTPIPTDFKFILMTETELDNCIKSISNEVNVERN